MEIAKNSALILIDIQEGDMADAWGLQGEEVLVAQERRRTMVENAKRVLDVFRAKKLPIIQFKEVHRKNFVDFGRELDGAEGPHLLEDDPNTDYASLTYPIEGEYTFIKRRYSCFFGTDLEILLKGLKVDTLYLVGCQTDVCVHYTAADAHQHDYHIKVVTDAVAGSSIEAHQAALDAIKYLQRDSWVTVADIESAL